MLFYYLSNVDNLKNIKLITHQTDLTIDKKLFYKKPKCISKWYSINVSFQHQDLIPIPIGIANDYSPKNLLVKDFLNFTPQKNKENKLYVNNRRNTNHKERDKTYELFINKSWCKVDEANLPIDNYKNNLDTYKFILCPPGNGLDTHRIWESLYLGSVPVVKKHLTYGYLDSINSLIVDNFEDLSETHLNEFIKNTRNNKEDTVNEKLKIDYWEKLIRDEELPVITEIRINNSNIINSLFNTFKRTKNYFESKIKIVKFYFRKLKKLLNKIFELFK